jgi:hypothetical protein
VALVCAQFDVVMQGYHKRSKAFRDDDPSPSRHSVPVASGVSAFVEEVVGSFLEFGGFASFAVAFNALPDEVHCFAF